MSLENFDRQCKRAFFQLVSEFGPSHVGQFRISEDEIKQALDYQRATQTMWDNAISFFENKGYFVVRNTFGLSLELTTRSMASSPSDQMALANALEMFRARAVLQEDYNNY